MAEKPEDQLTNEDKLKFAQDSFARGLRNYYVKSYSEAADELSEAAKLFGEVHGVDGDELGEVYLMYAKSLIAVGQDENKLIDVPEEDEDGEEDEPAEEEDDDAEETKPEENGKENGEKTNGHSEPGPSSSSDPQPGPSGLNENESSNEAHETDNEEPEDGGNLELAWEVLLNASVIFERQGATGLKNLMEVYIELGGISLENSNFEAAIKDFSRAIDVFGDLDADHQNPRIAAEVYYKMGLCQMMEKQYDPSVESFQTAADLIADVITNEKARPVQNEDVLATIKDLEEMQQDILTKVTEVSETKTAEVQVKNEMLKILGPTPGGSSDGAGSSSSSAATTAATKSLKSPEADKPKPTDISHLIKRKKPDSEAVESSPAKKKAVESPTGEKVAVAADKIADESSGVQVIEN